MADYIRLEVTGMEQTLRNLEGLPDNVERDVVKKAVRAGTQPIRRQATANIKARTEPQTGRLAKSMTKRETTRKGVFTAIVGPSWKLAPHAHLPEHGTKPRWRKRRSRIMRMLGAKGKSTGVMPAVHYMEDAFNAKGDASVRAIEEKLVKGIEAEAEKLGRTCRG